MFCITGCNGSRVEITANQSLAGRCFLISAITAGLRLSICRERAAAKPRGASCFFIRVWSFLPEYCALRSATSSRLRCRILLNMVGSLMDFTASSCPALHDLIKVTLSTHHHRTGINSSVRGSLTCLAENFPATDDHAQ